MCERDYFEVDIYYSNRYLNRNAAQHLKRLKLIHHSEGEKFLLSYSESITQLEIPKGDNYGRTKTVIRVTHFREYQHLRQTGILGKLILNYYCRNRLVV